MATGIQTSVQRGRRSGIAQRTPDSPPWAKAQNYWLRLSPGKKYLVFGFLTVLFLFALLASYTVKTNQFVDLYPRKLSQEDVNEVSMALTQNRIEHTIAPTLDGVLLSPKDRFVAQAKLAELSLPHEGPGLAAEPASFAETSETRKLAERRRLQSELVRTLRQIEGINDARVLLAVPKKTYFVDDQNVTKASVFLELAGAQKLDRATAKGIASLVSHSVADLKVDNVSLLDQAGRILPIRDEEGGFELEQQNRQEAQLEEKLQKALGRIYGDRVHAVVNLTLDFSQEEQRRYTPGSPADDGVVKDSTQLVHEILQGPSEDEGKNYDQRKEAVNYKYAENYFAKLRDQAKIERLTATVLVDGAGTEEMESIAGIVKGAIGIDEARGDEVFVSNVHWNRKPHKVWEEQPVALEEQGLDSYPNGQLNLAALVLAVFGTFFVCALLQKRPVFPVELDKGGSEKSTDIVDHRLNKSGSTSLGAPLTANQESRLQSLEKLVGSRPEKVAVMLRSTWLS